MVYVNIVTVVVFLLMMIVQMTVHSLIYALFTFQAHGWQSEGRTVHVPFPLETTTGIYLFVNNRFN